MCSSCSYDCVKIVNAFPIPPICKWNRNFKKSGGCLEAGQNQFPKKQSPAIETGNRDGESRKDGTARLSLELSFGLELSFTCRLSRLKLTLGTFRHCFSSGAEKGVFSVHDTGSRRTQILNFMRDKLCALLAQPVPKENTEYPSFAAYALRIRGREDSDACAIDKRFRRPASVNADT